MRFRNHHFSKLEFPTRIIRVPGNAYLLRGDKSATDAAIKKLGRDRVKRCKLVSRRYTWCFREPIGEAGVPVHTAVDGVIPHAP